MAAGKDTKSTTVFSERKSSLLSNVFLSTKNKIAGEKLIKNLQVFMETDSLYYGFSISPQPVVDSNIVSYKKQVPISEKFTVLPLMYKVLQDFISVNNLKVMQPPMVLFSPMQKDSISVFTMLAVNKLANKNSNVNTMKMPLNGRMLTGIFRGKYKNRIQLATAMQQYCLDKNILSIIGSYEKFTNNVIPINEESIVDMEIHFPIM